MHGRSILVIIGLRLLACLVIAYSVLQAHPLQLGFLTYCICTLLLNVRGGIGNNGSDQMTTIVIFLGAIAALANTPVVVHYAVLSVALQLSLAYFAAGSVKIASRSWLRATPSALLWEATRLGASPCIICVRNRNVLPRL